MTLGNSPAFKAPYYISSYELNVKDLDKMSAFYQDAIGLQLLESHDNTHILGIDGQAILTLAQKDDLQLASPRDAGLFHAAFLLPDRKDLANFLKHAIDKNVKLTGASDHLVSEALYLNDPEGNGIEIYTDRSEDSWPKDNDGIVMDTVALDIDALLRLAPEQPWQSMPSGTKIGHIHLRVGDLSLAKDFYTSVLNLKIMETYPGALFFARGGYHHHIATNIWHSKGSKTIAEKTTGLRSVSFHFNDASEREKMIDKAQKSHHLSYDQDKTPIITDPWNIKFKL